MPPRYYKVYDVDADYVPLPVPRNPAADVVGSAGPPPRPTNLPKFPNNTELVFDDSNQKLLAALLPALNKYDCLQFSNTKKTRRSPWVRAFCDLYHPAGPWGSNKFQNAPDITSKRKYSFKSYQIPTLYKQLQKYEGDSRVHLDLKQALRDFFGKEDWYKEFMEACQQVANVEVDKPLAERAPIPTIATGVVVTAEKNEESADKDEEEGTDETPQNSRRGRRRQREPVEDTALESPRCRTRAQRSQEEKSAAKSPKRRKVQEKEETEATQSPLSTQKIPAKAAVSPESSAGDDGTAKETLETKRAELEKVLSRRRENISSNRLTKDPICEKIQAQIDKIDEELLELILG